MTGHTPRATTLRWGATVAGALLLAAVALLPDAAPAQQHGAPHGAETHVFQPERRAATEERIAGLAVPEGFSVGVFARDLGKPRRLAVAGDGTVYATRTEQGDVVALDGPGAEPRTVASDLPGVHGIAIRDGRIYLAQVHRVSSAEIAGDGSLGALETVVDGLPGAGQHGYRTIGFAPDGSLHVNIGSSCNSCMEASEEKAADLRVRIEDGGRTVFAQGLRNHLGFDWHPRTGEMWATDQGVDHRGDDFPGEELNRIEEGAHYGWPYCIGEAEPDWMSFTVPPDTAKDAFCRETSVPPALLFPAHASALDLVFYDADLLPERYRDDAFVALHGSFNRATPAGYKVVRVVFRDGAPQRVEDFLTGFLVEDGRAQFGRPSGLAIAADGALLVADDSNGMIYRIGRD